MIISTSNPRVKQVVRLQSKSSARRNAGLFCIESERDLCRALDCDYEAVDIYVCEKVVNAHIDYVEIDRAVDGGANYFEVSEVVLNKITYRQNPQGFVAVMKTKIASLDELADKARRLFVVCSGLEKPGNIGAILRSADGAGADGVLIDSPDFDLYNPNCIRASTGAVFHLPVVCDDRDTMIQWLKKQQVSIVATTPGAAINYADADLTGAVALTFGAEVVGLNEDWIDAADVAVALSMKGLADSLNVSVTAAILLYEAVRQREVKK